MAIAFINVGYNAIVLFCFLTFFFLITLGLWHQYFLTPLHKCGRSLSSLKWNFIVIGIKTLAALFGNVGRKGFFLLHVIQSALLEI